MPNYPKEKMNLWMREARKKRKLEGLCVICGSHPAREKRVTCEVCALRQKEMYKRKVNHLTTGGKYEND